MSWLSNLFGGGGEDPEAVRQREAGYAAQAAARAEAAQQQQLQMQLDYLNSIRADQAAKEAALAAKDPTALRQQATHTLEGYFSPEFEQSFIPDSSLDTLKNAAYTAQRGTADDYITRLLKRGVITDTGATAARANLDTQGAKVRQQLSDLGDTVLNAERDKLTGIADKARGRASSLEVGDTFDLTPYQAEATNELGKFNTGLADLYNSQVPTNLFDTSTLGAVAGGAQGAGNRPFAPDLTGGTSQPVVLPGTSEETSDPFAGQAPVQKRTTSVF